MPTDHADEEQVPEAGLRDTRFEFDAPRFYDFERGSPESTDRPDDWFGTKATAGLRTPPGVDKTSTAPPQEATSAAQSLEGKLVSPQSGKKGSKRKVLASITNVVAEAAAAAAAVGSLEQEGADLASPQADARSSAADAAPGSPPFDPQGVAPLPLALPGVPSVVAPSAHGISGKASRALVQVEAGAASAPAEATEEQPKRKPRSHNMRTRSSTAKAPEGKDSAPSPWRSRAERIAEFEGRQPRRGRGDGRADGRSAAPAPGKVANRRTGVDGLTLPQSPALATRQRARPARFKPREEVEAEEMAALPPFKARKLRKSMFEDESRQRGVPAVPRRPATTQDPFRLVTDRRAEAHQRGAAGGSGR